VERRPVGLGRGMTRPGWGRRDMENFLNRVAYLENTRVVAPSGAVDLIRK